MAERELRFGVSARDGASAVFGRIGAAAAAVSQYLRRLDGQKATVTLAANEADLQRKIKAAEAALARLQAKKANPTIDLDIGATEAKIAVVQRQIEALGRERANIQIDIDKQDALKGRINTLEQALQHLENSPFSKGIIEKKVAALRKELEALGKTRAVPEVDLLIARAEQEMGRLRAQLADLNVQRATPEVDLKIAAAEAKIAALKAQLASIGNADVHINVDRRGAGIGAIANGLRDLRRGFTNAVNGAALFQRNLRQITLPASLANMVPALAEIGAKAQAASGALLLLPAAITTVGIAAAALVIGFQGFKDAFKTIVTPADAAKVKRSLDAMAEPARHFVETVRSMAPAWESLRRSVQGAMFNDTADAVRKLGDTYLPMLKARFTDVGTSFNHMFQKSAAFFQLPSTVDDINRLILMTSLSVEKFSGGFVNVLAAFTDIAVVGSSFMPGLAQSFTDITGRFRTFIETARADGSLQIWIMRGIGALKEFGQLAQNVGAILGSIFDAGEKSGSNFVTTLVRLTGELRNFFDSTQGQAALMNLFRSIRELVDSILPGVRAVLEAIGNGLQEIEPAARSFGTAIADIAIAGAPAITILATAFADLVAPMATGLAALVSFLGPIGAVGLAASVLYKGFGLLVPMVAALATALGTASARAVAWGAAMTGAAASSNLVSSTLARAATGVAFLARNLPIIGLAIAGVTLAWDAMHQTVEESTAAMITGSMSTSEAIKAEAANINEAKASQDRFGMSVTETAGAQDVQAEATKRVNAGFEEAVSKMGMVEGANARLIKAERDYTEAQNSNDPARIAAAHDALIAAKNNLNRAMEENTRLMENNTDAIQRNADTIMDAANSQVASDRAHINFKKTMLETNKVMQDGTATALEKEEAEVNLTDSAIRVAEAEGRKAVDIAKANGVTQTAGLEAEAYRKALELLSTQATGKTKEAIDTLIAGLDASKYGFVSVAQSTARMTDELLLLGINAGGEVGQKIQDLSARFDTLGGANASASAKVAAQKAALQELAAQTDGDTKAAIMNLIAALDQVPTEKTISINGRNESALSALGIVLTAIQSSEEFVTINGEPVPVYQALTQVMSVIGTSKGDVTIGGIPTPAQEVLDALLVSIAAGKESVTIGGIDFPARDVTAALLAYVQQQNPKVKIGADPSSGQATASAFYRDWNGRVITMRIRTIQQQGGLAGGIARGAYIRKFAKGGILGMKEGGSLAPWNGHQLTPMASGAAQMVAPRTWRVIGDRMSDDEAYIPVNRSPRSRSLLKTTGRRMGYNMVPMRQTERARGMAQGGLISTLAASMTKSVNSSLTLRGQGSPDVVAAINSLSADVRALKGQMGGGSTVGPIYNTFPISGNPQQTASKVAQNQRTLAEMGAFGAR